MTLRVTILYVQWEAGVLEAQVLRYLATPESFRTREDRRCANPALLDDFVRRRAMLATPLFARLGTIALNRVLLGWKIHAPRELCHLSKVYRLPINAHRVHLVCTALPLV